MSKTPTIETCYLVVADLPNTPRRYLAAAGAGDSHRGTPNPWQAQIFTTRGAAISAAVRANGAPLGAYWVTAARHEAAWVQAIQATGLAVLRAGQLPPEVAAAMAGDPTAIVRALRDAAALDAVEV